MKRLVMMLVLLAAPSSAALAQASGVTVIEHVRLIDGLEGPPVENASLVIRNGVIVAAGAGVQAPAGAKLIDMTGRTVMPGLISDHSHVGLVDGTSVAPDHYNRDNILRQLRQYEAYGVTTVTALGLNRASLFDPLRREMHAGKTAGADLFGVDEGIGAAVDEGAPPHDLLPVGDDQLYRPATAAAARLDVDIMAAQGSDLVKLWVDDLRNNTAKPGRPKIMPEVYKAVIEEAHAKGLRVAAHIYDLDDAKHMLAAGVDIIAHGVRDKPVDAAFITAMRDRGVWYIPTLGLDESSYLFAEHPEMLADPVFAASLQPALRAQFADAAWRDKTLASPSVVGAKRAVALNEQNLKTLHDAGVRIGFGTDSGAAPTRIPGWAEHRELQLMVEAGLTPAQAVHIATDRAAALLHRDDRGVLTAGRRADFLVLDGDPSRDIGAIDKIEAVWRGGVAADGALSSFDGNGPKPGYEHAK
jgi:imidazolonepropionase-like amidohydrolase